MRAFQRLCDEQSDLCAPPFHALDDAVIAESLLSHPHGPMAGIDALVIELVDTLGRVIGPELATQLMGQVGRADTVSGSP